MTSVVAGVIEKNGRILICRRRADQPHALKWEFPGGKAEPGESPRQALIRELGEELGIQCQPGRELLRYKFSYPGGNPILLIFIEVITWEGEIENRIFESISWEARDALLKYDFLEGDARFLSAFSGPEWKTERSAPDSASS